MPFKHGKGTTVYLDALDLSPYLNAADFSLEVDTSDTTTFTAAWKTALAGGFGAKADFGGFYDPGVTALDTMLGVDPGAVLTYTPGGDAVLGPWESHARLLSVAETAYAESSPVGGVVAIKWSALASGAVGMGDMLHAFGEDTNTTTGADKDDAAATSTGWIAHLHVSLVDGGSWVIKLQDAATTDWTDVTGASFTARTTPGSQRLMSAAATTTLRRHVRYVATRTGGSAGDGITFALAYSRNRE